MIWIITGYGSLGEFICTYVCDHKVNTREQAIRFAYSNLGIESELKVNKRKQQNEEAN